MQGRVPESATLTLNVIHMNWKICLQLLTPENLYLSENLQEADFREHRSYFHGALLWIFIVFEKYVSLQKKTQMFREDINFYYCLLDDYGKAEWNFLVPILLHLHWCSAENTKQGGFLFLKGA